MEAIMQLAAIKLAEVNQKRHKKLEEVYLRASLSFTREKKRK